MQLKSILKIKPLKIKLLLFSKKYGFTIKKTKNLENNCKDVYYVEFNNHSFINNPIVPDKIKILLIDKNFPFTWNNKYFNNFHGICSIDFFLSEIQEVLAFVKNPKGFYISVDLSGTIIKKNIPLSLVTNAYLNCLTFKENEVMVLLKEGYSYKEIGNELNISINTVRMHIKNLYRKLNINTKTELVSFHSKIQLNKTNFYERKRYKFSKHELFVFNYIQEGFSPSEIAMLTNKEVKYINRIIIRIKNKINIIFKK